MLPHVSFLTRLSRGQVAVALVVAFLLLFALSWQAREDYPQTAFSAIPLDEGWQRLVWVMPDSPAWHGGLRPGDVVRPVPPPAELDRSLAFEVRSGVQAGRVAVLTSRWSARFYVVLFAIGLEFLAAGLLVFWLAADRPAAIRFLLLAGATAAMLIAFPAAGAGAAWALSLQWTSAVLASAAVAVFFLNTPVPRWQRILQVMVWALFPLLVLYTYAVLVNPVAYDWVRWGASSYSVLSLMTGLTALAWPFLRREARAERSLWPVLVTSGVPIVVIVLGVLLPDLAFQRRLVKAEEVVASMALIPLGFVWAMLRYRLMGVDLGSGAVVRALLESTTDAIFVIRRDGHLVEASRAGLALLGVQSVRETGGSFGQWARSGESPAGPVSAMPGSVLDRVLAGEVVGGDEQMLHLPDGRVLWVNVAGTPIRSERGQTDVAVLIYRDVTERRRIEEALRQRELVEQVLESVGDGVFVTDLDRRVLIWNPAAERITGHPAADVLGHCCEDFLQTTNEEGLLLCRTPSCPARQALEMPFLSERQPACIRTRDGGRVAVAMTAAPVRDGQGAVVGVVNAFQDVSREREVERLKADLITVVSHELRTPLSSLLGFSELLLNRRVPADTQQQWLEIMHREARHLGSIIDDLLDLSHIESGRIRLRLEALDLREIVAETVPVYAAQSNRHELGIDLAPDLPPVLADRDRLGRILSNLLSNAIKYSPAGGLVTISARVVAGQVEVMVADQGVGIPPEHQAHIFDRFYRVDSSNTREVGGTGLGLTIVRAGVEMMGGRAWVESEVGNGSRFYFTLRAAPAPLTA